MWICRDCETENEDTYRFCCLCGAERVIMKDEPAEDVFWKRQPEAKEPVHDNPVRKEEKKESAGYWKSEPIHIPKTAETESISGSTSTSDSVSVSDTKSKSKSSRKLIWVLTVLFLVLGTALYILHSLNEDYEHALYLYNKGYYSRAVDSFEKLGNYRDSQEMLRRARNKMNESTASPSASGVTHTATVVPTRRIPTATAVPKSSANSFDVSWKVVIWNISKETKRDVTGTQFNASSLNANEIFAISFELRNKTDKALTPSLSTNVNGTVNKWAPSTIDAKSSRSYIADQAYMGPGTYQWQFFIDGTAVASSSFEVVRTGGSQSSGSILENIINMFETENAVTPDPQVKGVKSPGTYFRSDPAFDDSNIIRYLSAGSKVIITGNSKNIDGRNWTPVHSQEYNRDGWILSDYLY